MRKSYKYPSVERIIEYNLLALTLIKVKKSDRAEVLSKAKIYDIIGDCKETKGDIYDKAVCLFKGLIKKHAFASGNRRTAFIVTKEFLKNNKGKFKIKNDPKQARVMLGIREGYYTDEEIKEWIKNGKIRKFERFGSL
jgi:death-on-curing protein